ncbi:hypothetical protein Tco_0523165 [Tanacetum coccineum]
MANTSFHHGIVPVPVADHKLILDSSVLFPEFEEVRRLLLVGLYSFLKYLARSAKFFSYPYSHRACSEESLSLHLSRVEEDCVYDWCIYLEVLVPDSSYRIWLSMPQEVLMDLSTLANHSNDIITVRFETASGPTGRMFSAASAATIVTCRSFDWNACDLENIICVLHVFYLASGLRINIRKSNIYGNGVSADDGSNMARSSGCASGFFLFIYLGLPIGSNMSLISNWKTLVDRFHLRLSSWKANLVSIGGCLTLIESVLGSLGIYYLSIIKSSETVLLYLERARSNFFCREGGFNNQGCNFNGTWAKIVGYSNYLHSKGVIPSNSFRFKAGCGTRIQFWKDIWIGESPLDISDISQSDINDVEDSCLWTLGSNGNFNVWDSRRIIDSKILPSLVPSTIWYKTLLRKVNIFIWRMILDRLPRMLTLSV